MSVAQHESGGWASAYTPDPEILIQLQPAPQLSALGAGVIFAAQKDAYDTYKCDLMPFSDIPDPRIHGKTASDGYVDLQAANQYSDYLPAIEAHYQDGLTPEFYEKHSLHEGLSFIDIMGRFYQKTDDGEYVVPKDEYIRLLADLQAIHAPKAERFQNELGLHIDGFVRRLQQCGLGTLVPLFQERVAKAEIQLDDGWDTWARGGMGRTDRVYGSRSVVIAPHPGYEHVTLAHEFMHLIQGEGLAKTFPDHPALVHALYEAMATHVSAHLLFGGDLQAIDPDAHQAEESYKAHRVVVDLLANGGQGPLSVHDFIDAFVQDKPHHGLAVAIETNFPEHPQLLDELEALLKPLHNQRVTGPDEDQAIRSYVHNVRSSYDVLRKSQCLRSLLAKLRGKTKN